MVVQFRIRRIVVALMLSVLLLAVVSPVLPMAGLAYAEDGDGGFLRREDFNVFGDANRNLLSTQFGSWLARLLVRIMVIAFDASLVIGIGLLFVRLVMVLTGKATRESVLGRITDMAIAIIGVVLILTGGVSLVINYFIEGASEIQNEMSRTDPAIIAAHVVPAPGHQDA